MARPKHCQEVDIRIGMQLVSGTITAIQRTWFGPRYTVEYEVREMDGYVYSEETTRPWWRVTIDE